MSISDYGSTSYGKLFTSKPLNQRCATQVMILTSIVLQKISRIFRRESGVMVHVEKNLDWKSQGDP